METEKKEAAKNNIGRLCLKLKINPKPDHDDINKLKPAADQQEDQEVEDEDEELPFVCQVCNKRYKSGKALGGHKRMHNLPPKDNKKPKKNINTPPVKHNNKRKADDEAEQDEDEPVCPLCDKSFPSMKSLFGHMRSHPDRGWRGIQPPSSYSWSSSVIKQGSSMVTSDDYHMIDDEDDDSPAATPKRRPRVQMPSSSDSPKTPPPTSSDDHKKDLTKSLKYGNWFVTAKRGSSNSAGCSSAASSFVHHMDNKMKEAVIDLMLLAHQKPRSEFLSVLNRINKNKGQIKEKEEDNEEEEEEEEEEENSVEEDYIMKKIENNNKGKKRRKKMKLADLEEEEGGGGQVVTTSISNKAKLPSSSSNGGQYVCSVCKRSFPSYQALGGHRSSHNKTTTITKKNIILHNRLSSSDDDNNDDSSQSTDQTATTDHDKDDDGGDQVPAQKLDSKISLDFDLNQLPPSED